MQECLRRIPSPAVFLRDVEVADAEVVAGIEVVDEGDACLRRRFAERVQDIPLKTLLFDAPLATARMHFCNGGRIAVEQTALLGVELIKVFMRHEVLQRVIPCPFGIPRQFGPVVVIARLATHVDHAVDTGTPTQRFATRIENLPAIESLVRLSAELPVSTRIADAVEITDGNVNPHVIIGTACFDQENISGLVGAQSICQQTPGRSSPDNNIIKCLAWHLATTIENV